MADKPQEKAKNEFRVTISTRMGKGTIRLNENDCRILGIGIVDYAVMASLEKGLDKKVTAMSFSSSKVPAGLVIINSADAAYLGVSASGSVRISKKGAAEQTPDLVEELEYGVRPGEYETLDLEDQKEKQIDQLQIPKTESIPTTSSENTTVASPVAKLSKPAIALKPMPKLGLVTSQSSVKSAPVQPVLKRKVLINNQILKQNLVKNEKNLLKNPANPTALLKKIKTKEKLKHKVKKQKENPKKMKEFEAQIDALRN